MRAFALRALMICSSFVLMACAQTQAVLPVNSGENQNSSYLGSQDTWGEAEALQIKTQLHRISDITMETGNRAIGTEGSQKVLSYLEEELKRFGLQPKRQVYVDAENRQGVNLIVELPGRTDDVVMLGAHHDSVTFGPGMNDNGTGIVALLVIAQKLSTLKEVPQKTVRFVFWDGEEAGLSGSKHYLQSLSATQLALIKQYLNVDTIGTFDGKIYVLDVEKKSLASKREELLAVGADEALIEAVFGSYEHMSFPAGAKEIKDFLLEAFQQQGLNVEEELMFSSSTDVFPFISSVPTSGIVLINEVLDGDVLLYTPCYHQACDTLDNVDQEMVQKVIHVVYQFIQQFAY